MELPNDTELRTPDFTIISASAGSGKTHTLTLRLLQLLLSERIPLNRLRNILAITFTNNAAGEMRDRVLEYLKRGALGDPGTLAELAGVVAADPESLRVRCAGLIETILAEYSGFQILTIDSFLTRIFRASALEFGMLPGAEVVLDNRKMLDRAFEEFARSLAEDAEREDLLARLSDLLMESRRSADRFVWDPFNVLSREVRRLYDALSAQPREIVSHAEQLVELRTLEGGIRGACTELREIVRRSGFEVTANFLKVIDAARTGPIDGLLLSRSLFNPPLKRSGPNAKSLQAVDESNARCMPFQERIKELLRVYVSLRSCTQYEPYVQAYRLFRASVETVARRAGQISLTEINRKLIRFMDASVVPQIYLYLGDTIYHYLIDEFQDTAPVQWQALRPLIEEAISKQGSLFIVGDTKQSIYAFRHADWRIMRRLREGGEFPSADPSVLSLETNYRSGGNLVKFTTALFRERIPGIVDPDIVKASGLSTVIQNVPTKQIDNGYVEVTRIEGGEEQLTQKKLIAIVRDCVHRGYRFGDITVLTPKNQHVVDVSGWLNQEEIPFVSHSSLDIRNRPVIGDLLALLRFLASPVDSLSFAAFILSGTFRCVLEKEALDLRPAEVRAFLLEHAGRGKNGPPLYVRFRETYPKTWGAWFEHLLQVTGYLPMYDLVCEIVRQFRLFESWPKEEAALTRFLEALVGLEDVGANDLAEFLSSADQEDEDTTWSLDAPQGLDAVDVMTIHKAKGLDNRVVIVLLVDAPLRHENQFFRETGEGVELLHIRKAWTELDDQLRTVYESAQFDRTVDDLNKLYVALTRAKEEMYVLTVVSSRSPANSRFFPRDESVGERQTAEKSAGEEQAAADAFHPVARPFREEPVFRKIGIVERHRGEALHALLSKVVTVEEDVEGQVRRLFGEVSESFPDVVVTTDLVRKVSAFLQLPDLRPYYILREGRRVLAEQEFVNAEGQLFRMDRVVVDPDRVTVLDYKTGDDDPEYDVQIGGYVNILRSLFPDRSVQGVLAFIDRLKTREVA